MRREGGRERGSRRGFDRGAGSRSERGEEGPASSIVTVFRKGKKVRKPSFCTFYLVCGWAGERKENQTDQFFRPQKGGKKWCCRDRLPAVGEKKGEGEQLILSKKKKGKKKKKKKTLAVVVFSQFVTKGERKKRPESSIAGESEASQGGEGTSRVNMPARRRSFLIKRKREGRTQTASTSYSVPLQIEGGGERIEKG